MHARYVCDMSSVQVWFCIGAIIFARVSEYVCVCVRECVNACVCAQMCAVKCDIFTIPHLYVF